MRTLYLSQNFTLILVTNSRQLHEFDVLSSLQVLREGMGQAANVTNDTALDTVITNALIVDAVAGIIKADVGIKVCPLH